jgi:hypothetical protein
MREAFIDIGKVNGLSLGTLITVSLADVETVLKVVLLLLTILYTAWKFYRAIKRRKP